MVPQVQISDVERSRVIVTPRQRKAEVKKHWTPTGKVVKRIDEREHDEPLPDEYQLAASDKFIRDNLELMRKVDEAKRREEGPSKSPVAKFHQMHDRGVQRELKVKLLQNSCAI